MRQIVIDIRRKKDFVKLIPIVVAIARFDPNERINEAYEVGWGGALWLIFAYLHITSSKRAILEKTFFDQMIVFCSCFKIMIEKKCLGPLGAPIFF